MQTEEGDLPTPQPDLARYAWAANQTSHDVTPETPPLWSDTATSAAAYGTPPLPAAGCARCGLPAPFGASFCAGCGAPLAAPLTQQSPAQHMPSQQAAYGAPQMMAPAGHQYAAAQGQAPYAGYAAGNDPPAMWLPVPAMTIQMAGVPGGLVAARYAGFWLRLAAWVLDVVFLFVLIFTAFVCCDIVVAAASGGQVTSASKGLLMNLLALVVPWLYYTTAESSQQQATPGKRLIGLRVVTGAGARISFGRANGRYWSKQLSWFMGGFGFGLGEGLGSHGLALALAGFGFGIGYIICAFTARKQALHDLISGCCVVSVRR